MQDQPTVPGEGLPPGASSNTPKPPAPPIPHPTPAPGPDRPDGSPTLPGATPAEPTLAKYQRPTMAWEREATVSAGRTSLATAGLEFGVFVALGFFGGQWLDGQLGTDPWLAICLTMLMVGAAMWRLISAATAAGRASDAQAAEEKAAKAGTRQKGGRDDV